MKNKTQKDIRKLDFFCTITAVIAAFMCILFLLDVVQFGWVLDFILGIAVLLHIGLALSYLVRGKTSKAACCVIFVILYLGGIFAQIIG